jgi:hypothetical protein
MNVSRTLVGAVVVAICLASVLCGCERKTRTYAGISTPAPKETIDAHRK